MRDAFYVVLILISVSCWSIQGRRAQTENDILKGEIAALVLENEALERERCDFTTNDVMAFMTREPSARSMELMAMTRAEWIAEKARCEREVC